jgi:ribose 5-phosphate isomerase B
MVIYIAADHKGFSLKEQLKNFLASQGYEVIDLGNSQYDESDNYPDFAARVAQKVGIAENRRGILICGSGVGVDVVANKFPNIRSALVSSSDQAYDSRNDDDANVLSLGANYLTLESAQKIVETWLSTPFSHDKRHLERVRKISEIELALHESGEMEIDANS